MTGKLEIGSIMKKTSQSMASCGKKSTRKEIYVLQGDPNCGKSSTIKEIYRILSMKYPNYKITVLSKPEKYDITIVIKIKDDNGNEIIIGIESFGDKKKLIMGSLDSFANVECNIIFCAERSTKGIKGTVKQHSQRQYEVYFPPVSNLQKAANKKGKTEAEINCEVAKKIIQQANL